MSNASRSDIIDQLVGSYLTLPVAIFWESAQGLPFPDTFRGARLEFAGMATAWLNLEQIIWHAAQVRFLPGFPPRIQLTEPSIDFVIGQPELDRWMAKFELPYRLELTEKGIIVHAEMAGMPIAEFETRLEVIDGWFILKPSRATILGVPSYVSSLFRSYLPLPPLSPEARLKSINHGPGTLGLTVALEDFEEEVSPGLLLRLQKRFFPMAEQVAGMFSGPGSSGFSR